MYWAGRDVLAACFVAASACFALPVFGGLCSDPEGACPTPCPAEKSCNSPYGSGEGCLEGLICVPSCLPSWCFCDVQYGDPSWACSLDCAGECYAWPEPVGPPTHTITDLGTLSNIAYAINNYGHIAGQAGGRATLWVNGQAFDVGPYGGTRALDINNFGQALVSDNNYHVWLWGSDSGLDRIEELSSAYAINDAGQIVGTSSAGLGSILWQNGEITSLSQTIGIWAEDINNLGHVAGSVQAGEYWHAAVWAGCSLNILGTLGGLSSGASDINDLGQVIGRSERAPGGDRIFYSFFWDGQRMYDEADLLPYESHIFAINNCGEALLLGPRRNDEVFYVYHTERGLRPVSGVYGPPTGWWNLDALDMNDRGQIVGWGAAPDGWPRAFLISPIRGDLDWDGDADLADVAQFQLRFTGPLPPRIPGCERADLSLDGDVDLEDFDAVRDELSEPGGV